MSAELFREHAAELSELFGHENEVIQEGDRLYLVVREVALPSGRFNADTTDIMFFTDTQYPLSAPDMFWTTQTLVLADGTIPQAAGEIELHLGRTWRRFSWHRNGAWNPNANGLIDHFQIVMKRWESEAVTA